MLKQVTNWNALRRALEAIGARIFHCETCGNVWVSTVEEWPVRCASRACRAYANSPKRESVGRPPEDEE